MRSIASLPRLAGQISLQAITSVALAAALSWPFQAPAAEEFFAGKQIEVIVGSAVGGGYDAYARFLTRHMGRFVPGAPTFVVKNMPGAGGRIAANYLATRASRDGTSFGMFQNTLTLDQLAKTPNINFDMRQFSWIGNMNVQSTMCVLSQHARLESTKTMLEKEFVVGGTNAGSSISIVPFILNSLVGTKFKIVQGYASTSTILLAMQRREMDGMCGWGWDSARVQALQLIEQNELKLALDIGNEPHPELKARGVPFVMDMLPDGPNKLALRLLLSPQDYGRPFGAPPGIPADRATILRNAFRQTLEDRAFLTDAQRAQLEIRYAPSERIQRAIEAAFEAPPAVQDHAIDVLQKASR